MSSVVISTPAALGRPFLFDGIPDPHVGTAAPGCPTERSLTARERLLQSTISHHKIPSSSITPASQLAIRPAPEMASSGISHLDALTGGLPRGCLTEICGPASSGRTTLLLGALAAATRRGEFCALVDASDALDPHSAAAAGVELDRLLWVRCGEAFPRKSNSPQRHPSAPLRACPELAKVAGSATEKTYSENLEDPIRVRSANQTEHCLEQVLRATDLLLESGGFGLIILDLGDLPPQAARRIPLTTWFRFRRAVENKSTILLTIEQQPIAGSCSSLLLKLSSPDDAPEANELKASVTHQDNWIAAGSDAKRRNHAGISRGLPAHSRLLTGLDITAELIRSRLDRKPARSITFAAKTAWAG